MDVWVADHQSVAAGARLSEHERLLGAEERRRWQRLEGDRRRDYLLSRALLRTTLSRYAGVAPEAWAFAAGAGGKPRILPRLRAGALHFSLSRTEGLSICAVSRGVEVGVDVERVRALVELEELGELVLAPSERRALEGLRRDRRRDQLYRYWTLKEAYLKARGIGLELPPSAIALELQPCGRARLLAEAGSDTPPARWDLVAFDPAPGYRAALALPAPARIQRFSVGDPLAARSRTGDPRTT